MSLLTTSGLAMVIRILDLPKSTGRKDGGRERALNTKARDVFKSASAATGFPRLSGVHVNTRETLTRDGLRPRSVMHAARRRI